LSGPCWRWRRQSKILTFNPYFLSMVPMLRSPSGVLVSRNRHLWSVRLNEDGGCV
jgi:hypothetical protein